MKTGADISRLARAASKAGCSTMLQLRIAGELLTRGEATLVSLSHAMDTSLEAVLHAASQMQTYGCLKISICKETLEFSIADLTPTARDIFKSYLTQGTQAPLRSKAVKPQRGLRYTR